MKVLRIVDYYLVVVSDGMKPKVLVIGLGEVGRPLYEVALESGKFDVYGYDLDPAKTVERLESIPRDLDFMHVVVPYSERFFDIVIDYASMFKVDFIVIHSTIAPGTTRRIYEETKTTVAYSPVRGKHPNLKRHLLFWPKWVASLPSERCEDIAKHLEAMGFKVRAYAGLPETLEIAKLWETVYRAIMIASWQELHRIAKEYGAELVTIAEFIGEVHEVLRDRPIYFPGFIGGHCLIPNTKVINSAHKSKLFEFVLESNELRAEELQDPKIRGEVEKLKEVSLKYMNLEYYKDSSKQA